jgi:hypothetical protein
VIYLRYVYLPAMAVGSGWFQKGGKPYKMLTGKTSKLFLSTEEVNINVFLATSGMNNIIKQINMIYMYL